MPPHDDNDEWPQNHKSILRGQECAAILREEKNMETVGNFSLTTVMYALENNFQFSPLCQF